MTTKIRRLGNAWGVTIPKSMLQEVEIEEKAEIVFEQGGIVLCKRGRDPRTGCADASRELAKAGDDIIVWPEFANRNDRALHW